MYVYKKTIYNLYNQDVDIKYVLIVLMKLWEQKMEIDYVLFAKDVIGLN